VINYMAIKYTDYDLFSVGETWQLVKDEVFILGANDERVKFEEGTEIEIIDIEREGAYGKAFIKIGDYSFDIGLDEFYDMVWD
jgi:hypothetical protein